MRFGASSEGVQRWEPHGEHDPYFISDLSRLVFRNMPRGYRTLAERRFYPFPEYSSGAELVTLQLLHYSLRDLADEMPRDRHSLTTLLMDGLPKFGFMSPSMEEFHAATLERLAVWALVVRVAQLQGGVMGNHARALLNLMAKTGEEPVRFFDDATRISAHYRAFFDHGIPYVDHMETVVSGTKELERTVQFVEDTNFKGSLFYARFEAYQSLEQ